MLADKKIKTSRSNWKFDLSVAKNLTHMLKNQYLIMIMPL